MVDQEKLLTSTMFSINFMTFRNWITQKFYYGKCVHYVEAFKVSYILPMLPVAYRKKYADVDIMLQAIMIGLD